MSNEGKLYKIDEVCADEEKLEKGIIHFVPIKKELERTHHIKMRKLKAGRTYRGLKLDNYLENAENFYDTQPFFYDKSGIFWFWDLEEDCWRMVDDVDLLNALDKNLQFYGQTISKGIKTNYLEAFKRVGRLKKPKEAPIKWIQFKDKAYSLDSGNVYTVTPDYLFTNPIPWKMGETSDTPIMDKLFKEWVGEDNIQTLYEIIAYCCYRSYPIQVLFCLYGSGRNGKSCLIRLINRFLGVSNVGSTELDILLNSRFESIKLFKKLACTMGETNFGVLNKTSILKRLVGGDLIGFEVKNKQPFDDYNYAKLLIASNSLPSSQDTSEGFYRRWIIIDFPNEFKEGKDILADIPDKEYENLANKVTQILPELLKKGTFTNMGDIKQRKEKYIMASNPLPMFIDNCCKKIQGGYISYNELYFHYVNFLKVIKRRKVSRKEFKSALEDEGLFVERGDKKINVEGELVWKSGYWIDDIEFSDISYISTKNLTQNTSTGSYVRKVVESEEMSEKNDKIEDLGEEFI